MPQNSFENFVQLVNGVPKLLGARMVGDEGFEPPTHSV